MEQQASAGGVIGHLPDEMGHAFSCTSFPVLGSRERNPAAEGLILLEVMLGAPSRQAQCWSWAEANCRVAVLGSSAGFTIALASRAPVG